MTFQLSHRRPHFNLQASLVAPNRHFSAFSSVAALLCALCLLSGCRKPTDAAPAGESAKTGESPKTDSKKAESNGAESTKLEPPAEVQGDITPVGPELLIIPGKGVSAVRFGTNLENLQRHMGAPCDILSETRCAYVKQAAEFTLTDGIVSGMKFHRRGRLVADPKPGGERYYGSFNGGMQPRIMFGLFRHIMIEERGEPLKIEPLSGNDGQVERHSYDGVIFEYDQVANGNVILSGIEVVQSSTADQPKTPAPSKTTP